MRLAPGSFLWLVAHDCRNSWRRFTGMFGNVSPRSTALVLAGGIVLMHAAAWPVVHFMRPALRDAGNGQGSDTLVALVLCTFSWMVAQSLFGATRALFDRGDLDLLLGAPLRPQKIFAAKAVSIAAGTFGSLAILVLPIVHVAAAVDSSRWLGTYPSLIGLTLLATAVALAVSIGVFFVAGPVKARVVSQLIGAAIGGAFILAAQIVAMLPASMRGPVLDWFQAAIKVDAGLTGRFLDWPVEAFSGDAAAMLVVFATGALMFALSVILLGERFVVASLAAVGAEAGRGERSKRAARKFGSGIGRALRRKELLLLIRDPNLFAQLSLQIIYTVPVAVVLLRSEALPAALALAPTIVVIAAQIAASLAWITVSGEDAPELLATAPITPFTIDRIKLGAIVLPVLTILALPLVALAWLSWSSAIITALFAGTAAASTALLNFWHPMPGNRRGMLRRHSQSKLIAVVEHVLAVLWAITIVFALFGSWLAVVPAVFAFAVLAALRHRGTIKLRPAHASGVVVLTGAESQALKS